METKFFFISFWLLASAVTDIFIAVALFIRFLSAEVQYDSSKRWVAYALAVSCAPLVPDYKVHRLVRRLCVLSLKTGSLTAVSALAPLIGFWYNPTSNSVC